MLNYITAKVYFFVWLCGFYIPAYGQKQTNWWTRLSITKPISSVFYTELETQLRCQYNYFSPVQSYFIDEHLTHSLRWFIHYRPSSQFSASISPFTWFAASPVILSPADVDAPIQHEIRPSALAEWQPQVSNKLSVAARTWVEYRDFQNTNNDLIRFRQRLGLRYRLAEKWQAFLANEILLHIHGVAVNQRYDHNRLIFNINYRPNRQWRIELGYMYINRLVRNKMLHVNENNIITHFYYTLPSGKNKLHKNS